MPIASFLTFNLSPLIEGRATSLKLNYFRREARHVAAGSDRIGPWSAPSDRSPIRADHGLGRLSSDNVNKLRSPFYLRTHFFRRPGRHLSAAGSMPHRTSPVLQRRRPRRGNKTTTRRPAITRPGFPSWRAADRILPLSHPSLECPCTGPPLTPHLSPRSILGLRRN